MPPVGSSSPPGPVRRRSAAPLFTLLAAVAGLLAGRAIDQLGVGPLSIGFGLVVAACVIAVARTPAARPSGLRAVGRSAFRVELDRARRHHRTFAMARLELRAPIGEDVPAGAEDASATATVQLLGTALRITDHAWIEDRDVLVLMPESDRATAGSFVDRVRAAAPGHFTDRVGIAVFPDDGLTSGALLDALVRGMDGNPVPAPMVRTTVGGLVESAIDPLAGADPLVSEAG